MATDPRQFTRAEDELIVRQSRGEFPLKQLKRMLRATIVTINRRAAELGVSVCRHAYHTPPGRPAGSFLSTQDDLTPARIRNDKLLKQLQMVHPDRRYDLISP